MNKLDTTTAQKINALHNDIESLLNQGINKAIEIGELLTAKKTELPHGEFGKWITDNLIFSDRTARNYMRLFENKDKALTAGNISEAYKMLAEPKTETVSDLEPLQEPGKKLIKIADVICKKECYARTSINNDIVKKYSKVLGDLPPIEINQNNVLIDGWLRLEAHKLEGREYIPYFITETSSDKDILTLSAGRNSKHGIAYNERDFLKQEAIRENLRQANRDRIEKEKNAIQYAKEHPEKVHIGQVKYYKVAGYKCKCIITGEMNGLPVIYNEIVDTRFLEGNEATRDEIMDQVYKQGFFHDWHQWGAGCEL